MTEEIKRSFIPGEEWLYYKVYSGVETSEDILKEFINPFVNSLIKDSIIVKWFFIRYSDPNNHLRIRFLVKDFNEVGAVILEFKKRISPFLESNQVWNIQLNTYNRELERYGKNIIEKVESFFYYDSENALNIIKTSKDDKERFIITCSYIEELISLFKLEKEIKLNFLNKMDLIFKKEFNVSKKTKKHFNSLHKELKSTSIISPDFKNNHQKKNMDWFLKLDNSKELEVSLEDILSSFIHMTVNRVFRSKQRMYEMFVYDFLNQKLKAQIVRGGKF